MRILVLCHEHPPVGGGGGTVSSMLSSMFSKEGHKITYVTMGFGDLKKREVVNGYEVVRVPCWRRRREASSPVEGLVWGERCWGVVKKLHADLGVDVTHAHFFMPGGIVARRLKRKFGVPYIITPHGSDVPGHNRRRLRLSHMLAKPWWRRICSQADCVVSPSGSLLGLIKETGVNCRGAVIHNGFEAEKFIPLQKEKRILLCGRMVEGKGFDHFLEGIRDLELPGWTVDMVGDGPLYPSLCSMASKSKVSVTMHGWIDRSDPRLAELYGKAMVFVFPSEFENFSIALLEAMGAGCAVVATKIADNSEVIGNTGVLVRAKEPDELRQAIIGLSGDPDTCLRLGKGARQRALELFDWKSISWKYLKLLEAIGLGDSSETGFSPPLYHSGTK